jgi:puromycin-sensitive aminopeptidase
LDHQSTIKLGEKSWQVTGTSDDNKEETVTFRFPEDVPKCDLAILTIKWSVDLKKETAGLYRTTYRDAKGKRHTTISSHFEPTNARRCFPCFDEPKSKVLSQFSFAWVTFVLTSFPHIKATFSIRVVLDARFHVLSNMPPDTEDNIMPNVYPPMREWRFQKTPLMSTYLLGITAGEWDRVERKSKNGAVVRVWAPLGKASEAELASEWGTRALDFLDDYFATPYTLPKLDVVPIEDFSGIAMENWGVITFRARSLLVNSSTDSETILTMKEVCQFVILMVKRKNLNFFFRHRFSPMRLLTCGLETW